MFRQIIAIIRGVEVPWKLLSHWLETREIIFYRRYVDDILIIFDTTKTSEHTIQTSINMIHPLLHITPTTETDKVITYLDLTIHRLNHTFQLGIYHKPTQIDATIHFTSNHPTQQKLATTATISTECCPFQLPNQLKTMNGT
jgi:hypothetical protein